MKTYKFEYTWGVSTWDKAYCGFCTSSLAISWCVLLTDLAVLANIEVKVSLIVQGLTDMMVLGMYKVDNPIVFGD